MRGPASHGRSIDRRALLGAVAVLLAAACGTGGADEAAPTTTTTEAPDATTEGADPEDLAGVEDGFDPLGDATVTADASDGEGLARWERLVPRVEEVHLPSSTGDRSQPALWLPPPDDSSGPVPLLVVLHSFSFGHLQHDGIPFGQWAEEHGWAMIHPDFGGPFRNPESNGSAQAVQDVVDAVEWAVGEDGVDGDRTYAVGFSAGGQMSLLVAAQHPDRFAGVVSFVPVHDLVEWFTYNLDEGVPAYAFDLESSCGGDVRTDDGAREECRERSPITHIDDLAGAGVPVYLAHGVADRVVPPRHAGWAFNALADEDDRLDDGELEGLDGRRLPGSLRGAIEAEHHFDGDDDPEVVFARRSGDVTLVLFDGEHEFVVNPTLRWVFALAGGDPDD